MPRTNIGVPWAQKELEADLRTRYGGYMTKTQIAAELGMSRPTVYIWLSGMTCYKFDRFERYSVRDVAKKIYECRGATMA